MLYAELHNKFDVEALGFERSEDILTSTVFGTLLNADGSQPILREWIEKARFCSGGAPIRLPTGRIRYAFWPRLEGCTPDLALQFGDLACVIEAKFLSGPRDIERDGIPEPDRQLEKQWGACTSRVRLMSALESRQPFSAVSLLYVVDGVRGLRRWEEAVRRARCCDTKAHIGLLFWQDLHLTLTEASDRLIDVAGCAGPFSSGARRRRASVSTRISGDS